MASFKVFIFQISFDGQPKRKRNRDEAKQAWKNATVVIKKAKNVDDFTGLKKARDEAEKLRVEYLSAEKASDTDSDDENTLAMSAHG